MRLALIVVVVLLAIVREAAWAQAPVEEADAVLEANTAFYQAFTQRDMSAMDEIWAREAPVAVIHPGWNALFGRRAVMKSWASILGSPTAPSIHCENARALMFGGAAVVICYEVLTRGFLLATNLFVRESGAWKIVHHQAGPIASPPAQGATSTQRGEPSAQHGRRADTGIGAP